MLDPHTHHRSFIVRRVPSWMRRALALVETDVPAALYSVAPSTPGNPFPPIYNFVNTFQNGVALGALIQNQTDIAPGQTLDLSTGQTTGPIVDANFGYVVFGCTIQGIALAAPRQPVFAIAPLLPFATDVGIRVSQPTIPIGGFADSVTVLRRSRPFFCPPGFTPIVYAGVLGAGETWRVTALLMRVAAGFKPY